MRWKRPSQEVLREGVFPTGKPPFDPFPTITELANAYFCPLAAYYDLWYNVEYALESDPFKSNQVKGAGDVFQQYIAHLKNALISGTKIPEDRTGIWWLKERFENSSDSPNYKIWEFYLQPWSERKIKELRSITNKERIFFEVTVASSYVPFLEYKGRQSSYPLVGRIDEIDIDRKKIIERTVKEGKEGSPPILKDYQVWLLWKILCSVEKSKYPSQWSDIDFNDFELVVETPSRDFVINKNQTEFEKNTHESYAYIHDLAFEQKGVQEAYQARKCNYEEKEPDCALQSICYWSRPEFPSSREEMKREIKKWCRALLHEIMWNRDLQLYQFTMLNEGDLEHIGRLVTGKITDIPKPNQIEVEVTNARAGPVRAISSDQLKELVVIPFGSLHLGLRVGAQTLEKKLSADKLLLDLKRSVPISNQAYIFTEDFLLFQEQPVFLNRYLQSDLFWLERRGKKKREEALKQSPIQLLEGVFGRRILTRGGKK